MIMCLLYPQSGSILIDKVKLNRTNISSWRSQISHVPQNIFLSDGTIVLTTNYKQTISEERIWFLSENVRCRSSVVRTSKSSG